MYFETIHDLSDFEDVRGPTEEGYSSSWETETEFDSELGNFIFHDVTGDSASVICIDEVMDLLAVREQQQQMKVELEETRRKAAGCGNGAGDVLAKEGPGDLEEYTFEQDSDGKRSGGPSRHSHHSGSDGTYDGPQQTPIRTMRIVATPLPDTPDGTEDHVYETLDACQDHHFQVYLSKGPPDVPQRQSTPPRAGTNSSDNDSDKSSSKRHTPTKTASFRSSFGKSRSLHQSFEQQVAGHPRKERQPLKKKNSLDSYERGVQVAPRQYPAPLKGYGAEKHALPPIPCKRSPQEKMTSSSSPVGTNGSHNSAPPSLVIKHKGKTYVIPVVEKKKEGRARQMSSNSKRVHNVLCTASSTLPLSVTQTPLPPIPATISTPFANVPSNGFAPPKKQTNQTDYHDGNRRRKVLQQTNGSIAPSSSKHSTASNKVTHYGML